MACPPSHLCCCLLSLSSLCLLPLNHSAPLSTRSLPQFLPPLSAVVVAVAPPALLSLFGTKLHARLVDCCVEGLHPCPAPSIRSSLPPSRQLSLFVFGPPPCPRWPDLRPFSQQQSSSSLLWPRNAAEAVTAQQLWWQRSDGSAAMAMAAQRRLRKRSNGNGDGGAAMGVAVVAAAQQWRRSK